jgi:hypothetical protein
MSTDASSAKLSMQSDLNKLPESLQSEIATRGPKPYKEHTFEGAGGDIWTIDLTHDLPTEQYTWEGKSSGKEATYIVRRAEPNNFKHVFVGREPGPHSMAFGKSIYGSSWKEKTFVHD